MINDGVLIEQVPVGGQNTFSVRNSSGKWPQPPGKNQFSNLVDTMACVSYSAVHCIESQEFFLTGKVVSYSERFLAKMSGTTRQGNYQSKVLASIQQYGLVLDEDWPEPPNFTWDEYYADIPPEVLAKGQIWLQRWGVIGKHVAETEVSAALQEAPLQVLIIKASPYHAQELIEIATVFDTYKPFVKPLTSVYNYLEFLLTKKGAHMGKYLIDEGGKIGIMVVEGYTGSITFADTPEHLDNLKNALSFTGHEPTIKLS